jgi:hypothetical protein
MDAESSAMHKAIRALLERPPGGRSHGRQLWSHVYVSDTNREKATKKNVKTYMPGYLCVAYLAAVMARFETATALKIPDDASCQSFRSSQLHVDDHLFFSARRTVCHPIPWI